MPPKKATKKKSKTPLADEWLRKHNEAIEKSKVVSKADTRGRVRVYRTTFAVPSDPNAAKRIANAQVPKAPHQRPVRMDWQRTPQPPRPPEVNMRQAPFVRPPRPPREAVMRDAPQPRQPTQPRQPRDVGMAQAPQPAPAPRQRRARAPVGGAQPPAITRAAVRRAYKDAQAAERALYQAAMVANEMLPPEFERGRLQEQLFSADRRYQEMSQLFNQQQAVVGAARPGEALVRGQPAMRRRVAEDTVPQPAQRQRQG